MDKLLSKTTLMTAGVLTIGGFLVSNFTSGQSSLVRGGITLVATAVLLAFVVPALT